MPDLDAIARETGFAGVVQDGEWRAAYGLAHRALEVPITLDTRLALASGNKGMTALAVMSLVNDGALTLDQPVRSLLGTDLPLIDDAVTVEHLLGHRSGIGDYLDEDELDEIDAYVMGRPVHELDTTDAFLPLLDGLPMKFEPGTAFSYCNGGFMVLALVAQRAAGIGFHQLIRDRVLTPAGMTRSDFLRSDRLPGDVALGYLEDGRTNVFHLPVLGNGDGGLYSTLGDIEAFWQSLFAGRIVPHEMVDLMTAPRSEAPEEKMRYGLGFYLDPDGPGVRLTGYDAGVSFMTRHDPTNGHTWTVIANSSEGAWKLAHTLIDALSDST